MPMVTVEPEAWPPRVRIDAASTGGVYRTLPDGTRDLVRGSLNGGICYDYEAPQEVPVTYSISIIDETVVMPNVGSWLVHLTKPELSIPLDVQRDEAIDSPSTVKVLPLLDRAPHTVATGRTQLSSGLSVHTHSLDEVEALWALLKDESVLWLSTHGSHGWGPFYVRVLDVSYARFMAWCENPRRVSSLPVLVQERPVVGEVDLLLWELMPNSWPAMPETWPGMPG